MLRAFALLTILSTSLVCRFTVRDVGFVDLGDPTYTLYAFVSKEESPEVHAGIQRLASAMFGETNVKVLILDPDSEEEHDGHRLLRDLKVQKFPTTVLAHPDGNALEVRFDGEFDEVGGRVLESIVQSPIRKAITDGVLRRYCVVVLVEGEKPKENERTKAAVRESFKEIERVFDRMPKAVGDLPELIVIPRDKRKEEKVLLFSLGLTAEKQVEPSVAVMFGRGRRFGPILDGEGITKDTVLLILANAGRSCECDLDRSWMRGPRIPLRWDDAVKQKAVELLGFDPENPLVKSEISGILARGPKGEGERLREPTVADLLGSYSEQAVDTSQSGSDEEVDDEERGVGWLTVIWTLGGLLGLSIGAALVVLLRARRP